ncbi:uncharacterized protein LOC125038605 [Penaeus chinensis]|uniref:uncharacterized protein LOC125038605 n=1 Tax=Penaeus chinensis TaxID=139456 RepID=UPI001FB6614A|nr:uncharacterized protein LOC125038605 [Penaeus chinensis]
MLICPTAAVLVLGVAGEKPEDLTSQETPTEDAEARVKRQGGGIGNNFILPTVNNFRNRGNFGSSNANQFLNRPVQVGGGRASFSRNSSPSGGFAVLNNDPLGLFNRQSSFQPSSAASVQRFQGGQVSSTTFPPSFQRNIFNQRNSSPQRFTPSTPQAFGGRQVFNQGQRGFQPTPFQFAQSLAQRQQAQASFRQPQQSFPQTFGSRPTATGFQGGRPTGAQRPVGALLPQTRTQRPSTAGAARRPVGALFQQTRQQRPSTAGGRPLGGLSQQTGQRTASADGARRPTGVPLPQTRPQTPTTRNSVQRVSGVRFQQTGTQRPTGAQGFLGRPNSGFRLFVDSPEDSREFLFRNVGGRTTFPNRGFQQGVTNFGNQGFRPRPNLQLSLDLTQEDLTTEFNSRERFFPTALGGRPLSVGGRPLSVGGRTQVNRPNPFNQGFRGRPNFQIEVDVTQEDLTREFNSREVFLRNFRGVGRSFSSATARPQVARPNPAVQAFRPAQRVEIDVDVTHEDNSRELFLQSIRNTGSLGRPAIIPRPQGTVRLDVDITREDLTQEFNSREFLLQNSGFGRALPNTRPQGVRTSPQTQSFPPSPPRPVFQPRPGLQVEVDVTREDLDDSREIFLQSLANRPNFASATARPQAFRPSPAIQSFRPRPGVRVDFDVTNEDVDDSRELLLRPTGGRGRFQGGASRTSGFRPRPVLQVDVTTEDFDNDTFELFDD